ncbi:MAG: hypothetical protein KKG59_04850 [Nanoarchaeota archaeon]|nr:hypothetical protein [Nanoarchaeota archaeon]
MDKIKWCLEINKGLLISEPNEDLANAYLQKAKTAITAATRLKGIPDWQITCIYYSMYFSVYSILQKIGVNSQNHECTIEFAKRCLSDIFKKSEIQTIKKCMSARIESQYYTPSREYDYKRLQQSAEQLLSKCTSMIITGQNMKRIHSDIAALQTI